MDDTVRQDVQCAATTDLPVLITGPVHVAEALALLIHRLGHGRDRPFTVVNCEAREREIAAILSRTVDQRAGGTVFLKNVKALSRDLQSDLVSFVGTDAVRFVASTPAQLELDSFNDTLFYRLNAIHIFL